MRTFLRRLRGVVTTALLWAPVWSLAGAGMAAYDIYRAHQWHRTHEDATMWASQPPMPLDDWWWRQVGEKALAFAIVGAISGAVFALILAALERRRALGQLAMGRIAAWGFLGGMTLPLIAFGYLVADGVEPKLLVIPGLMGALGAACSTATLALARRPVPTRDST